MASIPACPRIYHITHMKNLPSIVADARLLADSAIQSRGGPSVSVGISKIKRGRMDRELRCNPGTFVGDYVPFYFCPRSIMLCVIYYRNHPELSYRGGQEQIVHLEADVHEVVAWAAANGKKWAFTLSGAVSRYFESRNQLTDLGEINWKAVAARDFRDPDIKEGKQAEFLVHEEFPWDLIRRIGVHSQSVQRYVERAIRATSHQPPVEVLPDWYF